MINLNQSPLLGVTENIPVQRGYVAVGREMIHDFFRRPMVISICTYLPAFLFGSVKQLAMMIHKCHVVFSKNYDLVSKMQVTVCGGDKLATLQNWQKDLEQKCLVGSKKITVFEFVTENSLSAARFLRNTLQEDGNGKVGILNLANRWQPGGVGLAPYGGSQEEYLVRRSNLAWGLDSRFGSNEVHDQLAKIRKEEGYLQEPFEHHIPYFGAILSQHVTFIDHDLKTDYDEFDIISVAAPDMRKGSDEELCIRKFNQDKLAIQADILKNKIRAVFCTAISAKIDNLVLGALGCGCFKNDSTTVARAFSEVLNESFYKNRFNRVVFAITDNEKLDVFQSIIQQNN